MAITKVTSALTDLDGGITIDNITIDGTEIDLSSGDLTIDVAGDIVLDAAGQQIFFSSAGTAVGQIDMGGTDLEIKSLVSNADLFIRGNDDGSEITALTFDMSDAGKATFNSDIVFGGTGTITSATNSLKALNTGDNGFLIRSAVSSAANPSYSNVDDTNTGMFLPGSDVIGFTTGGSERMRIDSSGRVSIGTTTTDRELKVQKAGDSAVIAIVSGTSNLAGIVMGDTDDDDIGHILYNNSSNSMSFRTNTSDRMKIPSTGHLVLEEGNGIFADTGRTGDVQITGSFTNVLNFNSIGGSTAGTGFYLVTAVRTGASVGTHIVLLVGVSDSSTAIIYATLASATMAAEFSNDTLRLRETGGSTINVHVTAVPIGITGND